MVLSDQSVSKKPKENINEMEEKKKKKKSSAISLLFSLSAFSAFALVFHYLLGHKALELENKQREAAQMQGHMTVKW